MNIFSNAEPNVTVDNYVRLGDEVQECYDASVMRETVSMGMRIKYYPKLQAHVYQQIVRDRQDRQQRDSIAKQIRNAQIMTDLSIREISPVEYEGLPDSHKNQWEQKYDSGPQWDPSYKYVRKPTPQEIAQQRTQRYDEIKNKQQISEEDYRDVIPDTEKHLWEEAYAGPQWDQYRVYKKAQAIPASYNQSRHPFAMPRDADISHMMNLYAVQASHGGTNQTIGTSQERWYIKGNDDQFYPVVPEMQRLLDENAPTRTPFSQQINGEQQPRRVVFDPDGRSAIQVKHDSTSREIKKY